MTLTALLLIIASAFLHATWNLVGKRERMTLPFFGVLATCGAIASVWLFAFMPFSPLALTRSFYAALGGMLVGQLLYGFALCRAYRELDMSVAYPMLNALPLPLIACTTALFKTGASLPPISVLGMALVFAGCLIVPVQSFAELRSFRFRNAGMATVFAAAIGVVVYTLCDSEAQRLLRDCAGCGTIPAPRLSIYYYALRSAALAPAVWIAVAAGRRTRAEAAALWRGGMRGALAAGVCAVVSYPLVLLSMNYVSNIAYVQSFRQTGLLIGFLEGVIVLHERCSWPKVIGLSLIVVGLAAMLLPTA